MPLSAPSPLGLGTPEVEALSSYVQRLAVYQGSFPGQLLHRLLAHVAAGDETYLGRWRRRTGSLRLPSNMNGFGHANAWAKVLGEVFAQHDLQLLTTQPWERVFPCRHLLAPWLRLCPQCLSEDKIPYHRLLWCIDLVRVCAKHRCLLVERCPHCGRRIPVVHLRSRILQCPWCAESLLAIGLGSTPQISADDDSFWVAAEIARLLQTTPSGREPRCLSGSTLRRLCRRSKIPHAAALGTAVGTSKITAWYWWSGHAVPSLPMALRICRCLDLHLVDALFPQPQGTAKERTEPVQLCLHLSGRSPARELPWANIREKLLLEIARPLVEARALLAIARELKVSARNLRVHEPELCRKIGRRYIEARKQALNTKHEQLREQIAQACLELRKRGHRITAAKVASALGQPGLFCRPMARRALVEVLCTGCRNWCRLIIQNVRIDNRIVSSDN